MFLTIVILFLINLAAHSVARGFRTTNKLYYCLAYFGVLSFTLPSLANRTFIEPSQDAYYHAGIILVGSLCLLVAYRKEK